MTRKLPAFFLWRLAGTFTFVIVVSSAALLLIRWAPGDAATDLSITSPDPRVASETRARLGLDKPPLIQLGSWLSGLAHLDLGTSSRFSLPVAELVFDRAANTATLAGSALALATMLGVPIGVWTGSRRGYRRIVTSVSLLLVACPPILFTLALLYFSVITGGWLPVASGRLVLPLLALALPMAAVIERLQSRATEEALDQPAAIAVAARGVPAGRVLWVHAFKSSLHTVLGVYGVIIATLFSGSIAVETITAWPGLGRLMLDALTSRDVLLVAGCALAVSFLISVGNIVADVVRAVLDPRVREA